MLCGSTDNNCVTEKRKKKKNIALCYDVLSATFSIISEEATQLRKR